MLHNDALIRKLYYDIDQYIDACSSQEEKLPRPKINLLAECGSHTLGGEVLNLAVTWTDPRVVEFLLTDIDREQSKLDLNSKEYKEYQALVEEAYSIHVAEDKARNRDEIVKLFICYNTRRHLDVDDRKTLPIILQESKDDLYASLWKDGIGIIAIGALIAISTMHPSTTFKAVFGVLAVLAAIGTGLHIKNSTVPSYVEMQENSVKYASQQERVLNVAAL